MAHHHNTERGFTLIELMLTVSLIGILAAIALPSYQDYTARARVAEALEFGIAVEKTVSEYHDRWGVLPADNAAAGLPGPELMRGSWVSSIEVHHGLIAVHLHEKTIPTAKGKAVLVLRPAHNPAHPTGPLLWLCQERAVPQGLQSPDIPASLALLPTKFTPNSCRKA